MLIVGNTILPLRLPRGAVHFTTTLERNATIMYTLCSTLMESYFLSFSLFDWRNFQWKLQTDWSKRTVEDAVDQ